MGTNCAPLLPDLFLHSYEAEFSKNFYTFRYIDDVLSLNNKNFSNFLHLIYQVELVKDTADSPNSASYLEHDINGTLTTKLYDKRDDFNFPIINYPFLDGNIPSSHASGVYMSQLIRYSKN